MASLIRWTWVWASSRSWWWTGKPGMLQSMGSQRVGHNWITELNWTDSLEGLKLKLKLQSSGHLMQRTDSLEKTLMMGKIEGRRRRRRQRMRRLDGITDSMDMSLSKFWETLENRGYWNTAVHGVTKSWSWLSDWTTITNAFCYYTSNTWKQSPAFFQVRLTNKNYGYLRCEAWFFWYTWIMESSPW